MAGRKRAVQAPLLEEWRAFRIRRTAQGASLWRIANELAASVSHSPWTIRMYLDPRTRERARIASQIRRDKLAKQRTREKEKSRERRQMHGDRRRAYEAAYRRITRNPKDHVLRYGFADNLHAKLATITTATRAKTGQNFKRQTIERILRWYSQGQLHGRIRGPPYLHEDPPGMWHYTDERPGSRE